MIHTLINIKYLTLCETKRLKTLVHYAKTQKLLNDRTSKAFQFLYFITKGQFCW